MSAVTAESIRAPSSHRCEGAASASRRRWQCRVGAGDVDVAAGGIVARRRVDDGADLVGPVADAITTDAPSRGCGLGAGGVADRGSEVRDHQVLATQIDELCVAADRRAARPACGIDASYAPAAVVVNPVATAALPGWATSAPPPTNSRSQHEPRCLTRPVHPLVLFDSLCSGSARPRRCRLAGEVAVGTHGPPQQRLVALLFYAGRRVGVVVWVAQARAQRSACISGSVVAWREGQSGVSIPRVRVRRWPTHRVKEAQCSTC